MTCKVKTFSFPIAGSKASSIDQVVNKWITETDYIEVVSNSIAIGKAFILYSVLYHDTQDELIDPNSI